MTDGVPEVVQAVLALVGGLVLVTVGLWCTSRTVRYRGVRAARELRWQLVTVSIGLAWLVSGLAIAWGTWVVPDDPSVASWVVFANTCARTITILTMVPLLVELWRNRAHGD